MDNENGDTMKTLKALLAEKNVKGVDGYVKTGHGTERAMRLKTSTKEQYVWMSEVFHDGMVFKDPTTGVQAALVALVSNRTIDFALVRQDGVTVAEIYNGYSLEEFMRKFSSLLVME
jgi:hypothetical protein